MTLRIMGTPRRHEFVALGRRIGYRIRPFMNGADKTI